ncbi:hypothetical protein Tco_1456106, partial [Tanacetum coccineum]
DAGLKHGSYFLFDRIPEDGWYFHDESRLSKKPLCRSNLEVHLQFHVDRLETGSQVKTWDPGIKFVRSNTLRTRRSQLHEEEYTEKLTLGSEGLIDLWPKTKKRQLGFFPGDIRVPRLYVAAMKHMASNFAKYDKFEGLDFRRWQKKMHFLLSSTSVVYVLTTHIPEDGENATMEQIKKRN